jgi:hypothetical protein
MHACIIMCVRDRVCDLVHTHKVIEARLHGAIHAGPYMLYVCTLTES